MGIKSRKEAVGRKNRVYTFIREYERVQQRLARLDRRTHHGRTAGVPFW